MTLLQGGKGVGGAVGNLAATAFMATPTPVQLEQLRAAEVSMWKWTAALGVAALVAGILGGNALAKKGGGCPVSRGR